MLHLPLYLEKRLKELYPRQKDRDDFVKEVVKQALEAMDSEQAERDMQRTVQHVGGTLHLFTDGGSRGNPGQAAIGVVIADPSSGAVLKEYSEPIGIETNNIAEYKALIRGLELVSELNPNSVICHLDSELVVKQIGGQYRVKMPHLLPLLERVHSLKDTLRDVSFVHVPRSRNAQADALVNKALDAL